MDDDAQDAEALRRAAVAVGVEHELDGATERQLALLRRSSSYAFALLAIQLRALGRALPRSLFRPISAPIHSVGPQRPQR